VRARFAGPADFGWAKKTRLDPANDARTRWSAGQAGGCGSFLTHQETVTL